MRKVVVIHQPDFLPYLGYFHRLLFADVFVVLDDVQFLRRGWHHRDKIKTRQGEAWLTLSIEKTDQTTLIRDVRLSRNPEWIEANLNLIAENYRQAAHFAVVFERLEAIYRAGHQRLVDLNLALLKWLLAELGIDVRMVLSSSLAVSGTSNERLINLVKAVEGTDYLTGIGSKEYLREELFFDRAIQVQWQNFKHPTYTQLHGDFIPYLSAIDARFNCDKDTLRRMLRSS